MPELAARAARLTSRHHRRLLARSLGRAIDEAQHAPSAHHRVVMVYRGGVFVAADVLRALIERLDGTEPLTVKGMALVELILTDAVASPLHNRTAPGDLGRAVLAARAALEPDTHEHPLAI